MDIIDRIHDTVVQLIDADAELFHDVRVDPFVFPFLDFMYLVLFNFSWTQDRVFAPFFFRQIHAADFLQIPNGVRLAHAVHVHFGQLRRLFYGLVVCKPLVVVQPPDHSAASAAGKTIIKSIFYVETEGGCQVNMLGAGHVKIVATALQLVVLLDIGDQVGAFVDLFENFGIVIVMQSSRRLSQKLSGLLCCSASSTVMVSPRKTKSI